jgi:hypothetical protein
MRDVVATTDYAASDDEHQRAEQRDFPKVSASERQRTDIQRATFQHAGERRQEHQRQHRQQVLHHSQPTRIRPRSVSISNALQRASSPSRHGGARPNTIRSQSQPTRRDARAEQAATATTAPRSEWRCSAPPSDPGREQADANIKRITPIGEFELSAESATKPVNGGITRGEQITHQWRLQPVRDRAETRRARAETSMPISGDSWAICRHGLRMRANR